MKTALIAIGRRENQYAREWVEHHLTLGFDHIYIFDNNHDGEEMFIDVLMDYVEQGRVSIIDYRNQEKAQRPAYNDAYQRLSGKYDWLAFFDFDEFLVLHTKTAEKDMAAVANSPLYTLHSKLSTLHSPLSTFLASLPRMADCVLINWQCYGDGGLVRNDTRPVQVRFTKPLPRNMKVQHQNHAENEHVKCIVRGGLEEVTFHNPHVPETPMLCCLPNGSPCEQSPFQEIDYRVAYLKHYVTKTIEEWVVRKCQTGVGDRDMARFNRSYDGRFWLYNRQTVAKLDVELLAQRNIAKRLTVCIVHYNTPELTLAAILSLNKQTPGCRVIVLDNSDQRPFNCNMINVKVIDNTRGQLIDFDKVLESYPDREDNDRNRSNYGSAKHTMSVDWLMDHVPDGFILMDSDVLIHTDIAPIANRHYAAAGRVKECSDGIPTVLRPFLCWINVPMLREHHIRYFNGEKMWALSHKFPNNRYDTGAWLYEECVRCGLPINAFHWKDYALHFGHGSWKEKDGEAWLRENRGLWQ